ncbi:MAG: ABC transporter substrate-binding protein [Anaerolineaceae bacterium]|nr:ABC transporter substrate-binding protein [Anaerolineaceae bacterium]
MRKVLSFFMALVFITLAGCGGASKEPQSLKVAVLPVLDVLPLYVAEAQGYFEKNGVQVELVPVGSAPERDQLMQAGQIDGMLTELVVTLLYNREMPKITVVRFARTATAKYPLFRILAAKGSGITTPAGLAGVPIGVSDLTVIEYTTDRLLEKAGLTENDIATISVPKIPDRLALLGAGELKAANLPDPVASVAIQNGAVVVIDDTSYPEISNSVYAFNNEAIRNKPEAVRAFLTAVEEAVADLNRDKTRWNDLMVEKKLIPPNVLAGYTLPDFPTAAVPSREQFADALAWVQAKGAVNGTISYESCVDAAFLP